MQMHSTLWTLRTFNFITHLLMFSLYGCFVLRESEERATVAREMKSLPLATARLKLVVWVGWLLILIPPLSQNKTSLGIIQNNMDSTDINQL